MPNRNGKLNAARSNDYVGSARDVANVGRMPKGNPAARRPVNNQGQVPGDSSLRVARPTRPIANRLRVASQPTGVNANERMVQGGYGVSGSKLQGNVLEGKPIARRMSLRNGRRPK